MIKERFIFQFSLFGIIVMLLMPHNQVGNIAGRGGHAIADTSSFSANTTDGWGIVSSYLNQDTPDSVEFEMILKKDIFIDWSVERFIGSITNSQFIPANNQAVTYNLLINSQWNLRVDTIGKCYLHQVSGGNLLISSLPGNPYVLPIKIRYKNN